MKKQNLQNERLDQIGLRLLDAARLRSDEIDGIASAPHLFDSVKVRIKVERTRREANGLSVSWESFWALRWQMVGMAFGVFILLLSGAIVSAIFTKQDSSNVARENETQATAVEVSRQPETTVAIPGIEKTQQLPIKAPAVQRAVSHNGPPTKSRTSKRRPEIEELGEFYALTYAGDPEEDDDGGQIIRVELPRSSLYAMGINVPVENETRKIKTDLLIGSDGVMRAVRFVK